MNRALLFLLLLASCGCAHRVIAPSALDLARCPDNPPPLHPNVIIGSTPCEFP